jgi:diguanylate cyclase (GGDEF)-like protein
LKETILVVDDEPHIRRILSYLLEQQGYELMIAAGGREALELTRDRVPDLVLLDLMMPEMDGYQVCAALREDYRTRQVPIIIVTAKGEIGDKVRGLEGGANDYLTKPYDNKELLLRVRNMLEWSRAQRQANPLTGLPGNQAIEKEVQNRIDRAEPFAFLYLDIDNFKAYNDSYGYSRGDEAIRFAADILRECTIAFGSDADFVGHIGGDDFCVVTTPESGERMGNAIADAFDAQVSRLLDEEDRERGYLEVRGRQGGIDRVAFPTLTIAVVLNEDSKFEHWARVSDVAVELKTFGKRQVGSIVVTERRTQDADQSAVIPDTER